MKNRAPIEGIALNLRRAEVCAERQRRVPGAPASHHGKLELAVVVVAGGVGGGRREVSAALTCVVVGVCETKVHPDALVIVAADAVSVVLARVNTLGVCKKVDRSWSTIVSFFIYTFLRL
jgi:hypothetical protein